MKLDLDTFNSWIRKHKLFAVSLPIIVILTVYFLANSISSLGKENIQVNDGGYNEKLPRQENEMQVEKPNELYKQAQEDSLDRLRNSGTIKNIVESKEQPDSLELVLEELNAFSFDDDLSPVKTENPAITDIAPNTNAKTIFQEKLEYRKLLMEARNERRSNSQDYTAPYTEPMPEPTSSLASFHATIYRDQFILPGNRVTLILTDDVQHNGKRFAKNTFVYAVANIQGSRVLLEVANIDKTAFLLTAIDQEDGMVGLHNERAGQLLNEFKADATQQGSNELSEAVGNSIETPIARNLIQSFGTFFQRKKYKQRDKILLVNGDRVVLTSKNVGK